MEIIIIRHAAAEDRRENLEDVKRHLTKKGKKNFQKSIPELMKKLEPMDDRTFQLWTSPAFRALETAEIVSESLQIPIDSRKDSIYTGDFETLQAEIEALDEKTTLLVVGHEPSLSQWIRQLTGEDVKIRKGDMLNVGVLNQHPLQAELRWVISRK